AILAEKLGVRRVASAPALSEIDYGPWEGLAPEEIVARWPEEARAWKKDGVWPSSIFGGTFEATQARLRGWLAHLDAVGASAAVAVTSQGTLRALYGLLEPAAWEALRHAGRATEANVATGHWCELEIGPSGISVLAWNERPSFFDRLGFLG
ncbi:MAG TPA: histidine phosphatase family protein, partial [Patescibacteria group bacterium]|nr:histidine phosphatase family protein [Patescibacteria group bacterium]